jgi:hypothetical protein
VNLLEVLTVNSVAFSTFLMMGALRRKNKILESDRMILIKQPQTSFPIPRGSPAWAQ